MRAYWMVVVSVFLTVVFLGCDDPCKVLAQRICDCERTEDLRRTCVAERIEPQQAQITPSAEELERCTGLLDTCDCNVLDVNDTSKCGFTREGD